MWTFTRSAPILCIPLIAEGFINRSSRMTDSSHSMPPIRTRYTQYMTPEQQTELYHARIGDFILVERNNDYWFLLLIDAMSAGSSSRAVLLVKPIHNPERQTIFDYQRFGTWHAMCSMWSQEAIEYTTICAQDDRLTLRCFGEAMLTDGC